MKQFIRIPRTSEISDNLISDILKARFPEYSTSIHGNEVRMRKNALTTVCVKCKQERNETVITIDTILFWWVWLIIGWIFYLVSKKGVIDEVYSTLVRDLSNRFPDKFRGYPSAYESAIWASKTKSLFKIGLGIVIYYTIFNSFLTPILINYIFGEIRHDTSGIILFIFVKNFWMCDILWILLGVYFLRLKKLGVGKRTGLFLMIYGIVGLLFGFLPYISESLNTILFNDEYQIISIITVSSSYLILLLYMGYFCKNELKTGPARYFDISICIYAITSYVTGVIFTILSQLWKKEGIIFNEYYLYVTIIETLLSLVTIYACFMLLRALHKMPKYPPVKTIQENDESTEFVVQQPQPSRKLQSESNPKPKPVSEPKPNLKPKPISTPKSGDSKRYKKSFIGALKYQIKNLLPNYKYAMILIFINTLFLNLYGSNLLDIWLNVKTSNIDIFYGITQSILVISLFVIWIKQTPSNAVDLIIIVFIGMPIALIIHGCLDNYLPSTLHNFMGAFCSSIILSLSIYIVIPFYRAIASIYYNSNGNNAETGILDFSRKYRNRESQLQQSQRKLTGTINGHEWVDLGLPSGLKWATCNVGATSPEEYGDYFAWGETTTKDSYPLEDSKTSNQLFNDISGDPNYDTARANWGRAWRMPTKAECEELKNNCKWTWTTNGRHNGYKVTGPNGNSIFLPASGRRDNTSLSGADKYVICWSSTPVWGGDADYAYNLNFFDSDLNMNNCYRGFGLCVRPVTE